MIRITVYRADGVWHGARWIDGEYDGCDPLPCDDDWTEDEALDCARHIPLRIDGEREVVRVDDVAGSPMSYRDAVALLQRVASDLDIDLSANVRCFVGDLREILDWAANHPDEARRVSHAMR